MSGSVGFLFQPPFSGSASGGIKLQNSIRNSYAMGKLKMVVPEFETATKVVKNRHSSRSNESGGFVLWQMTPEMWYVKLVVSGSKVHAGCNGKLVWGHTPWLGAHAAKGPVRPLRRALQAFGLITGLFSASFVLGSTLHCPACINYLLRNRLLSITRIRLASPQPVDSNIMPPVLTLTRL